MKQKLLLTFMFVFALFGSAKMKAVEDSTWYKSLVITEVRSNQWFQNRYSFIEVTNMHPDSTLNLGDYWIQGTWGNFGNEARPMSGNMHKWSFPNAGSLAPGESYFILFKNWSWDNDRFGDPLWPDGYTNVHYAMFADTVIGPNVYGVGPAGSMIMHERAVGLFYRGDTSSVPGVVARDSVMYEKYWLLNTEHNVNATYEKPIAGVVTNNPYQDYVYLRKTFVKKGHLDFDNGRGSNMENSEWIPIPLSKIEEAYDRPFTTFNHHGNTTELSVNSKRDDITIDMANKVINFPYGVRRDSLFWNFEIGDNHAWSFQMGPDTAQWYVSNGDTIVFYVCGNSRIDYTFGVNVAPKESDFVKARPLWYKNDNDVWVRRYVVSDGLSPLDTVGNIYFNTAIDTLLEYLVLEEGTTHEFVWVDGVERPEVKNGDILRVKSGAKSKDYLLSVWDYVPNGNAALSTVYFPGLYLWENPKTFELTDTMLEFRSNITYYSMALPVGTTTCPALVAKPQDARANVKIKRAVNLNGTDDDRTATITVASEDDSTVMEYKILFNVKRPTPEVEGNIFFSDLAEGWDKAVRTNQIQIFNPTREIVDMSEYLLIKTNTAQPTFEEFWAQLSDPTTKKDLNKFVLNPSRILVPGNESGMAFLAQDDASLNQFELEGKGTYCITHGRAFPIRGSNYNNDAHKEYWNAIDYICGDIYPAHKAGYFKWNNVGTFFKDTWGDGFPNNIYDNGTWWPWSGMDNWQGRDMSFGKSYIIAKIVNDSIIDGTKGVSQGSFFDNYEIVDIINGIGSHKAPWRVYDKTLGKDTVYDFGVIGGTYIGFYRKPWVYSGNPVDIASFGSPEREGEWAVYGHDAEGKPMLSNDEEGRLGLKEFGQTRWDNHTMITYAHIPYITSTTYVIGKGLEGEQPIFGVTSGTNVAGFMQNIIKADTGMLVVVTDAVGNVRVVTDPIEDGDKVVSTSANRKTSVNYKINLGALSNDVSLSAKGGSGLTVDGLTVKGVVFGTTLKALNDKLEVAPLSQLEFTDGMDYIIPREIYSNDTLLTQEGTKTDVLAVESYKVEVTAQDGTKAIYAIELANENRVYVLSDVYKVYEEFKTIDHLNLTTVNVVLNNINVSPGAHAYIINKKGQLRDKGIVSYDDQLVVEKGNVKVMYMLKFNDDDRRGVDVEKVEDAMASGVYPNPTSGMVRVANLEHATQIQVRNLTGQLVQTVAVHSLEMNIDLDGPTGVYFISVYDNNNTLRVEKVVKR